MDTGRLIQMAMRLLMRHGLNRGIDYLARRGKPASAMTPEDHAQARSAKGIADKARKGARLVRRFGRF